MTPSILGWTYRAFGINILWTVSANTDYHDIYRRTNGGPLVWLGRGYSDSFTDGTIVEGTTVSYVVRAGNDRMSVASNPTAGLTVELFRITDLTRGGTNGKDVTLAFSSISGVTYRVETSSDLNSLTWSDAGVSALGTGDILTITIPDSGSAPRLFFRVVTP